MKFFIPNLGPDSTEVYYAGIRSFLAGDLGLKLTPRRVHKLSYNAKGQRHDVTVGRQLSAHEVVFAILETNNAFLICTPQRGIGGESPIKVKRKDVIEVVDFDPIEAQQPA